MCVCASCVYMCVRIVCVCEHRVCVLFLPNYFAMQKDVLKLSQMWASLSTEGTMERKSKRILLDIHTRRQYMNWLHQLEKMYISFIQSLFKW